MKIQNYHYTRRIAPKRVPSYMPP